MLNNTLEQSKIGQNKHKTDGFASVCPEMLPFWDDFRTMR